MKIRDIVECITAKVCVGEESLNDEVKFGFASDLMSDVLTIETDDLILITGLTNLQSIRTAEMSDIKYILFVRNKKVTPEMLELATDNGMVILESPLSMFRAIGELYKNGLKPIY